MLEGRSWVRLTLKSSDSTEFSTLTCSVHVSPADVYTHNSRTEFLAENDVDEYFRTSFRVLETRLVSVLVDVVQSYRPVTGNGCGSAVGTIRSKYTALVTNTVAAEITCVRAQCIVFE